MVVAWCRYVHVCVCVCARVCVCVCACVYVCMCMHACGAMRGNDRSSPGTQLVHFETKDTQLTRGEMVDFPKPSDGNSFLTRMHQAAQDSFEATKGMPDKGHPIPASPTQRTRAVPVHSIRATRDTCNGQRRRGRAAASHTPRTASSPRQLVASTPLRDCTAADSAPSVPLRNARVSVMRLSMRSASRVSPRVNEGSSSWLKCL